MTSSPLKWVEDLDRRIQGVVGLTPSLPWSLKEGILLLLYLRRLSLTRLMKVLLISHVKFRIPYRMDPSVWHYGPSDRKLHKYIKLVIEEGYVQRGKILQENGEDIPVYELTDKGRTYVKTTILPWGDLDKYRENIMVLLSLPTDLLTEYANHVARFKREGKEGNVAVRISYLEDFSDQQYNSVGSRIVLHTLLSQYIILSGYMGDLPFISTYNVSQLPEVKQVNCSLKEALFKSKIPRSNTLLFELKNCVLNRFLYVLATYIINVLEQRWATLEEITCLTHDLYFEAVYKRPFRKYLSEEEGERLDRRGGFSRRSMNRDLKILKTHGFLEETNGHKTCYKVTSLSFTDGLNTVSLPRPEWIRETYNILKDEISFLNHRTDALERGFHGVHS